MQNVKSFDNDRKGKGNDKMKKVEKFICYSHKIYLNEKICKKVIALKIQKLFHCWQRYVLNYIKFAQIVLSSQIDQ